MRLKKVLQVFRKLNEHVWQSTTNASHGSINTRVISRKSTPDIPHRQEQYHGAYNTQHTDHAHRLDYHIPQPTLLTAHRKGKHQHQGR